MADKPHPLTAVMEVAFNHFPGVYPSQNIIPYEVETDGDVTYTRYTDGMRCVDIYRKRWEEGKVFIFKTTKTATLTRNEKAWDYWKNRKTASYRPINAPIVPGASYS